MTQKLNCRPGDLAIIVRCRPGSEVMLGKVVQVKEATLMDAGHPGWLVDPVPCPMNSSGFTTRIADRVLKPLRGAPGRDETLVWQRVPLPTITLP